MNVIMMIAVLILVLIPFIFAQELLVNSTEVSEVKPIIVNGEAVHGSMYPWMVSLRMVYDGFVFPKARNVAYYQRFCGGSLISIDPITIVTAAHCLDFLSFSARKNSIVESGNDAVKLFADLGRTKGPYLNNNYDESGDEYVTLEITDFASIRIHEQWNTNDVEAGYDIALITITDQTLPSNYAFAKLPNQKDLSQECCAKNEILTAIGYGLNNDDEENGKPTDTLERITMQYHPSEECLEFLWTYSGYSLPVPANIARLTNNQICAKGNDQDICRGDSGGPLFRLLPNGDVEIVGISSYILGSDTDKCNTIMHPLPSAFTSVAHYHDWIHNTMKEAEKENSTTKRSLFTWSSVCCVCLLIMM